MRPTFDCLFARIDLVVQSLLSGLVSLSLFAMSVVVIVLIVARYVFGIPIFWGEELARYLMIYMALTGAAVALRGGQHPRLSIFADMLPPGPKRVLRWMIDVMLILTLVVLFYHGLDIALHEGRMRTPALRIEYVWVFIAVPIGAVAMITNLVFGWFFPNAIILETDDDIEEAVK